MELQYDNEAIISRIKYLIDSKMTVFTQSQFARRLGIDPSNLSKYLTGKLPVSKSLINRLVVDMNVSKQWLLFGEGIPFPRPEHAFDVMPCEITTSVAPKGVPVYDVDVTAGCSPLQRLLTQDRITGYIDLPRINPDSIVVRVCGDSMEPKIIDGGYIAIRPVRSTSSIFWGQIYVIVLEDYRMVKYLRRDPSDPSNVILHSANPNYDDMDVRRDDIQALFLVESILNFKNLC